MKVWSLFKKPKPAATAESRATAPEVSASPLPMPSGPTRTAEATRRHAQMDASRTEALPIDGEGIERVEKFALADATPSRSVTVFRPVLRGGREPSGLSFAIAAPPEVADLDDVPDLGIPVAFEWDGSSVRCQVGLPRGSSCYGTGCVPGPLLRNGRIVNFWNTDAWRYGEGTPALYQSHPYVLAVLPDGSALGILADSSRRGSVLTVDDGVEFAFEDEPFDLFLIEAATPVEATRTLMRLIGHAPLPPRWALGYHQSRWSYESAQEVLRVAKTFREHDLPCDAIWLDIDHADRFRPFTWNRKAFPDPEGMIRSLEERGFHVVAILDPGLPAERDYDVHANAVDGGHLVTDARNRPVKGRMWPGVCSFPDFTRDETRDWWADLVTRFSKTGLHGIWNDMNEPSVFRTPSKTLPDDARHAGFGGGPHKRFHNVYGQLMSRATRKGLAKARPDRRPFVLTRSSFLGGQRYAATWTGDNQARWEDLRWAVSMVLNLSLCGQPFAGADVGGYEGDPTPELYVRWFELGAFLPFFRGHSDKSSCRKEPWALGTTVENLVRPLLEQRMRLLPTWYTLFREAETKGLPPVRPLFFKDPEDESLRAIDDAFLVGDDLLVAPVLDPGKTARDVVFPPGRWYAFPEGGRPTGGRVSIVAPLGKVPVFARAGAIIVEGGTGPHAEAAARQRLTLHIYLDSSRHALGRLYEDSGDGYDYEDGDHRDISISASVSEGGVTIAFESHGRRPAPTRRIRLIVHGARGDGVILVHEVDEAPYMTVPLEAAATMDKIASRPRDGVDETERK